MPIPTVPSLVQVELAAAAMHIHGGCSLTSPQLSVFAHHPKVCPQVCTLDELQAGNYQCCCWAQGNKPVLGCLIIPIKWITNNMIIMFIVVLLRAIF